MHLDLTDAETEALIQELSGTVGSLEQGRNR
jgi:hypothetical protein